MYHRRDKMHQKCIMRIHVPLLTLEEASKTYAAVVSNQKCALRLVTFTLLAYGDLPSLGFKEKSYHPTKQSIWNM